MESKRGGKLAAMIAQIIALVDQGKAVSIFVGPHGFTAQAKRADSLTDPGGSLFLFTGDEDDATVRGMLVDMARELGVSSETIDAMWPPLDVPDKAPVAVPMGAMLDLAEASAMDVLHHVFPDVPGAATPNAEPLVIAPHPDAVGEVKG